MNKKLISLLMAGSIAATLGFSACGDATGANTIKFYAYGDEGRLAAYQNMIDDFEATVGKEHGIKIAYTPIPESGYASKIEQTAKAKSGPDVFVVLEKSFKKWATMGYFEPLDTFVANGDMNVDDIWTETVNRYRYDTENNTSNADDPLYSLPIDSSPTALYYNRSIMEDYGIVVIGVEEKDMDAWNAGTIPDKYGNYKSDIAALNGVTVPAKGYYRSIGAYNGTKGTWQKPNLQAGCKLVFNDQIAMNWNEVEDLAMLFTQKYNSSSPTIYGYYTEWWFNYGWSVGGDCIEDLSGNGDWTFTLADNTPNYIVMDGQTYTGAYTGKTYQAGETIEFLDKLDVEKTDTLTADNAGGYKKNGVALGDSNDPASAIRQSVKDAATAGTLGQLPSIKTAFTRFASLAGDADDLNVCPYPSEFETTSSFSYFVGGKTAMIIEEAVRIEETEFAEFEWNVAPLPIYKEYNADGSVKVQGVQSGHSNSISVSMRAGSSKKESAYIFLEYLVGEQGQAKKAEQGYVPNQRKLVESEEYQQEHPYMNVFLRGMDTQGAGDWWYMADTNWISNWADPLNGKVRYGTMGLETWFTSYIASTNELLKGY